MLHFYENRLDANFAIRLVFSGVAASLLTSMFVISLIAPMLLVFGPLFATLVTLGIFCLAIAVMAEKLRLVPFPLIEVLHNRMHVDKHADAVVAIKHTAHALPLSFSTASLWLLMLMEVTGYAVPAALAIASIPPVTILLLIVNCHCNTPGEALKRSTKGFLVMVVAMFFIVPGIQSDEAARLEMINASPR